MNRRQQQILAVDLEDRPKPKVEVYASLPPNGEWANSNNWGNSYRGVFPPNGSRIVLVDVNSVPGPPRVYTFTLNRSNFAMPADGTFPTAAVYADIEYGAGAVRDSFVADWGNGAQFSVIANSIRITARTYNPVVGTDYDTDDLQLALSACLGEGSQANHRATYTEPRRLVPDTTGFTYPVPDFAKRVLVQVDNLVDPITAADFTITQLPSGLVFNGSYCALGNWLDLRGDTQAVQVIKASAGAIQTSVIWELSL